MPLKARLLGKAVGDFFETFVKSIPKEKIELQMEGVGDLFRALHPLLEDNGKMSVKQMRRVFNEENGKSIGNFFNAVITAIPNKKAINETISSVKQLLELVTSFGAKEYGKIRRYLTPENGQLIGEFFAAVLEPLKDFDKNVSFNFKNVAEFLETLAGIGITGAVGLKMLKPILTPEFGENIAGFIRNLTSGISKDDIKQLKEFTTGIKQLS